MPEAFSGIFVSVCVWNPWTLKCRGVLKWASNCNRHHGRYQVCWKDCIQGKYCQNKSKVMIVRNYALAKQTNYQTSKDPCSLVEQIPPG